MVYNSSFTQVGSGRNINAVYIYVNACAKSPVLEFTPKLRIFRLMQYLLFPYN